MSDKTLAPPTLWPLGRRTGFFLVALMASLVCGAVLNRSLLENARTWEGWVVHTQDVMAASAGMLSSLRDAQTGEREYLYTGESFFLDSYQTGRDRAREQLQLLRQLTRDNALEQSRLRVLTPLVAARLDQLQHALTRYTPGDQKAIQQYITQQQGMEWAIRAIRSLVAGIQTTEEQLLAHRAVRATRAFRAAVAAPILGIALMLVLLGLLVQSTRRDLRTRQRLHDEAHSRAAALEQTLEALKRFTHMVEMSFEPMLVWQLHGGILEWNRGCAQLYGYSREEVLGRASHELLRTRLPQSSLEEVTGILEATGSWMGELRHVTRDGREVLVESRWELTRMGGQSLVLETNRDVTARRRAEQAVRDIEQAARIGSWDWHLRSGEFLWSEQCKELFGVPARTDMSYELFLERIHPDDRAAVQDAVRAALERGERYEVEMRVPLPDGSIGWRASKGEAYFDSSGKAVRMSGMALDITAAKQAEERLRENAARLQAVTAQLRDADQRKDEFLATLAHELRNPLAPIRYAVTLLRPGVDGAALEKARDMIDRQAGHLARLLDDLLDVSRITRNAITLQSDTLDLRRIAADAGNSARPAADAQRHRLTLSLPPQAVWVRGDAERILQIIGNLLNNAIKYTGPGGRITLSIDTTVDRAVLRVQDNGVGFPPEKAPRLFELFSQLEQTSGLAKRGLGIGLAVVDQLVKLHGGSLEAESAGPGRGATFSVRFPLAAAPKQESHPVAEVVPLFRPGLRVLVVDDNVDAAESLGMLLRSQGVSVQVAHSGAEALQLASVSRPGIVLLDIGLPDMSGHEVARELRRRADPLGTIIIAVSGWAQEQDRRRSQESGIDRHLAKPVDARQLFELMESLDARGDQNS